jgi:hypothetical protein
MPLLVTCQFLSIAEGTVHGEHWLQGKLHQTLGILKKSEGTRELETKRLFHKTYLGVNSWIF